MSKTDLITALLPTEKQMESFRMQRMLRQVRTRLEILVVGDQASSQLLCDMLKASNKTMIATDAKQAWKLFLQQIPDITFISIELPDIDGHRLANLIQIVDPKAYFIMVSEKNSAEDISKSKQNGSKGFIVKPYDQQKVTDVMQKYQQEKKKK